MAIELACQSCGQTLRVADEHAGKRARCPKCQQLNWVPGGNASPEKVATPELWQLKLEAGDTYGPVTREELNRWYEEGRISPRSQLQSDRTQTWQWAGEVYTALGIPLPTTASPVVPSPPNLFSDSVVNPYASPQAFNNPSPFRGVPMSSRTNWQKPHRGALILTLAICGFVACPLFAPVAVVMGHSDLSDMRNGRMDPDGRGLTLAGVILGWIVTIPMMLALLLVLVTIVVGSVR